MAFDEGLAERIREALQDQPDITEKRMFGGIAFFRRDMMFVGIAGERLMARIGPDYYETALNRPHVSPMDFTGKPMRGYVFVGREAIETDVELIEWLRCCRDFVATLPPKAIRSRSRAP
jgi:TfoX/Sxy family transcriptional regulator of competence genes